MNSRYKFKTWNINWKNTRSSKLQGRMIQWEDFRDEFIQILAQTSFYIVMQFTGIYDREGVEIYEGDIIQDDDIIVAIEWNNASAGFFTIKGTHRPWSNCKVIGNIYQNPKLLK